MFGFEGWRLKVNGKIFPSKYIHAGSYKITPDQETDLNDFTDNDGRFHRNVLPAKATKIEFNIKPVYMRDMKEIKKILPEERTEVDIEYWNDWKMCYQSGRAYIPDITFEPYMDYPEIGECLYNPTRVAFIEYGEVR